MPLLNYTTTVAATKTANEVTTLLARGRARSVMTDYDDDGRPTGIAFAVETPYGLRSFMLPVNTDAVRAVLGRDKKVPKRYQTREQAERVAWRILKDWLEAQLAIIATEMVTLDQVMLPYMQDGSTGRTVYELYVDRQLALPAGEDGGA